MMIMDKPILYVLVGISGSGKSTWAKEHIAKNPHCAWHSSDNMRIQLFNNVNEQNKNDEVFKQLHLNVVADLKNGRDVIYDATSLTIKDRMRILEVVKKIECYKICVTLATPLAICLYRDTNRDRMVGAGVINRQVSKFQIPFYEEGYNEIHIVRNSPTQSMFTMLYKMQRFNQQNKYHSHDLLRHSQLVLCNISERVEHVTPKIIYASLLHDYGKLLTQTFDDSGQAHYYSHENVGTYHIMSELVEEIPFHNDLLSILFLMNYHMLPHQWKTEKAQTKWERIFGKDKYNLLIKFHESDKLASGYKEEEK